jgi:hypothetical protein
MGQRRLHGEPAAEEIRARIAILRRRTAQARQRAASAEAGAARLEEQALRAPASLRQACLRLAGDAHAGQAPGGPAGLRNAAGGLLAMGVAYGIGSLAGYLTG